MAGTTREEQIICDALVALELASGSDDDDYQAFRDNWIAQRFDQFDDDNNWMMDQALEEHCRQDYIAALGAAQDTLLDQTDAQGGRQRRGTNGDVLPTEAAAEDPELNQGGRQHVTCIVCAEGKPSTQAVSISCGHGMCNECVSALFRSAMTDESLFPPRCCRNHEISLDAARPLLSEELATRFQEKAIELRTTNRTYCHVPRCSTFIMPDTITGDVATCATCGASTCALCKGPSHRGQDCPLDEGRQQVEQLAREQGWRQCEGCHRMVELNHGCYHMTCLCGHQFCYLCGVEWKHCRCPNAEEHRLYQRAQDVANRPRPVQLQVQPRQNRENNNADVRNPFGPQNNRMVPPAIFGPAPQRIQRPVLPGGRIIQAVQLPFPNRPREPVPALRPAGVQEIAEHLRENHECTHQRRWRRFHTGINRCEICYKVRANPAVGECPTCFLQACYYCRKHRMR